MLSQLRIFNKLPAHGWRFFTKNQSAKLKIQKFRKAGLEEVTKIVVMDESLLKETGEQNIQMNLVNKSA